MQTSGTDGMGGKELPGNKVQRQGIEKTLLPFTASCFRNQNNLSPVVGLVIALSSLPPRAFPHFQNYVPSQELHPATFSDLVL